jgi:hypothetical protein
VLFSCSSTLPLNQPSVKIRVDTLIFRTKFAMGVTMLAHAGKNLFIIFMFIAWLVPGNVVRADDCEEARQWHQKGLALDDNSEKEASYYQKAIKLCPHYFEVHNKLGEVYKTWGDYESAIKEFKEAGESASFAEPHYNLGEIYRVQGRYDLAEEEFKKAIKIKPDFREVQNQLQYVQKRSGTFDVAIEARLAPVRTGAPRSPIAMEAHPGPKSIEPRPGPAPIEARPGPVPIEARSRPSSTGASFGTIPTPIVARTAGTGMTLPKGSFLVDFQYEYWTQESGLEFNAPEALAAPDSRDTDVHMWIGGIRYGLTRNLTIGLCPKFFQKTTDVPITFQVTEGPGRQVAGEGIDAELEVSGFGDTVFLTKYRLWRKGMTHLSVFHLLSIPTGDEDETAEDEGVERRIPLGSGSVDFTPGIAFTTVKQPLTIHSNIRYVITDGRHAGDEFHWDVAVAFPSFHNLIPIMELNYRWADSAERDVLFQTQLGQPSTFGPPWASTPGGGPQTQEGTLTEEGGHTLFLSPGIQLFLPKGFRAEIGVQFPVIEPDDGWVEEFVFHVGIAKYFL